MSYFESAEGLTINKARAVREVLKHGCDVSDFFADMGTQDEYSAQAVLLWLGY
jgi:hypothetical protein